MLARPRRWKSPSFPLSASKPTRAVVEGSDGAERWLVTRALEEAGFDVVTCDGPIEQNGPCPLVAGRGCAALDGADVVINLLGLRSPAVQDIVRAIRAAAPSMGIVAQASPYELEQLAPLLRECGCSVISPLASTRTVVTTAVEVAASV